LLTQAQQGAQSELVIAFESAQFEHNCCLSIYPNSLAFWVWNNKFFNQTMINFKFSMLFVTLSNKDKLDDKPRKRNSCTDDP